MSDVIWYVVSTGVLGVECDMLNVKSPSHLLFTALTQTGET